MVWEFVKICFSEVRRFLGVLGWCDKTIGCPFHFVAVVGAQFAGSEHGLRHEVAPAN